MILFAAFLLYAIVHEGGHALAAVIFGGKITALDVNILTGDPHAGFSGNFTKIQSAIIAIAGPLLPVILWVIAFLAIRKNGNTFAEKIRLFLPLSILPSVISNAVLAVLTPLGLSNNQQDITNFIDDLSLNGFAVAIALAALTALLCILFFKGVTIKSIKKIVFTDVSEKTVNMKFVIPAGAAVLSLFVFSAVNLLVQNLGPKAASPPDGYKLVSDIQLNGTTLRQSTLYQLKLNKPRIVRFYIWGSGYSAELHLRSKSDLPGIRGKDVLLFKTNGGGQTWYDLILDKGSYNLDLTAEKANGELKLYDKISACSKKDMLPAENLKKGIIPTPPHGYRAVCDTELTGISMNNQAVYQFELNTDSVVGFCAYTTSKRGFVSANLVGSDGSMNSVLDPSSTYTDQFTPQLNKGRYKVVVHVNDSDGRLVICIKK